MSAYLIEIAFGPVQGFIAASRRSRDLWGGSKILSEIARAAAISLMESGAELIYPVKHRVERKNQEDSNLSNVLLARFEAENEAGARMLADAAIQSGKDRLQEYSDTALHEWSKIPGMRTEIWNAQIGDAIEAYAAWSEISGDYHESYKRLKSAFAARKNTRDFFPANPVADGIPKSSLDGLRESVLPKNMRKFPVRFGLSDGEQLDALGAIKRHVGRDETFTALTRLAADPWLHLLPEEDLASLREAYEPLVHTGFATRAEGNQGIYKDFPYDGGLLYRDRLDIAIKDGEGGEELKKLKDLLRGIWKKYGHPSPYAAILMADGDRMGKFVSSAKSPDDHSRISGKVADFADSAIGIIREHRGHTLYAGGEDVMALMPLPHVVDAARMLAADFDEKIATLDKLEADSKATLRVGVAICHILEPLGRIRQHAEAAEKFAKGEAGTDAQGNALGLRLHVRAGHDVPCRIPFSDETGFSNLVCWIDAYRNSYFPGRLAYDTRAIGENSERRGYSEEVARSELKLLLARAKRHAKRPENAPEHFDAAWNTIATSPIEKLSDIEELGNVLVLARWLSARTAAELGEK